MEKETKHRDIDVLIIDDEPPVRNALSRLLKLEGYRVQTANSGVEGLKLLEERAYSILICDLQMPEMNGDLVLKEALKRGFKGQRYLITGAPDSEIPSTEGVTVLKKPWDGDKLKDIVSKIQTFQSES